MVNVTKDLAYFHGLPEASAALKTKPEHFFVSEMLNFTPSGSGEHFFLQIRKKGENTKFIANELAKACGVKSRDVGWAGLKDRHAITEQWFSVHLPTKVAPNLAKFVETYQGVKILTTTRHRQKLRPGSLIGNQFSLLVTQIQGDKSKIEARLNAIKTMGVPNYFGDQRFGNNANNLTAAREWGENKFQLKDKSKRSFYLSAARSHLFNLVLSFRIEQSLLKPMQGDLLIDDKGNMQQVEYLNFAQNLLANGWQISGPMTGDNALPTLHDALKIEQQIIESEPTLLKIIQANRMQHERRALMVKPKNLTWQWENGNLQVSFGLPAGAFATALMREVTKVEESAYIPFD